MRVLWLEIDTARSWALASMGPASITAYLRKHGHQCMFLRVGEHTTTEEVISGVRSIAPSLVALSLTMRQWLRARDIVKQLRDSLDIPVIVGGVFPSHCPREVLSHPGFDYVCLGEGEVAMLELLVRMQQGVTTSDSPLRNIWRKNGPRPPVRKPVVNLDALPFMARDLLDEIPGVCHIVTQRGCPYKCTCCSSKHMEGIYPDPSRYPRRRSIDNVLSELERLAHRGPMEYVVFLDDTFTSNNHWLKAFVSEYPKRIGVRFSIRARPDSVNEALLKDLAAAGCHRITYGIESGSWRVRQEVLNRPVSTQRLIRTFEAARDVGISPVAVYRIGFPGETHAELEETFRLHAKLSPADFEYHVFYPYPGTPMFTECQRRGYLPHNYLERPVTHRSSILNLPDLTQQEIEDAYGRFTDLRRQDVLARYGENLPHELRDQIEKQVVDLAAAG